MNIKKYIILLLVFLSLSAQAQNLTTGHIKGLKIGDKVPNISLPKIVEVDGRLRSAQLTDYFDRLLILDFMYTTCGACIEGLPKKDYLQRQFGDSVKIMVVVGGETYAPGMLKRENEKFIRQFLTNKKSFLSRNNVQLPWVVENKLLNAYFPHQLVSHLAWIYKGKLVAITEQDYVTEENIRTILSGKKNNWPIKNDFRPPVDLKTPLVRQEMNRFTGGNAINRYAAVLGCYEDGISTKAGLQRDSVNHMRRDYIINLPILKIYISRWGMFTDNLKLLEPSHIILEVNNPLKYIRQEDSIEPDLVTRRRIRVCYESIGPDTNQTDKQVAYATIKDLDHLLGLYGRYERRKMKCLTLIRTESKDIMKTNAKDGDNFGEFKAPHIKIDNMGLNNIVWKLNQFYGNPPAFDETGYKDNVDMEFTLSSWQDIPALRKALQPYGLDLKEEERELEVFVLTEKGYK